MSRFGLSFSIVVLFLFFAAPSFSAADVEQWRATEITLTSSRPYARPFYDVDVVATFTGPAGQTIARPAFWDGGNTWRVRFAPTEIGAWSYVTACSDPANAGLHGQRGAIVCEAYRGQFEIYGRGFLRVADDHRHLAYRDGTPFFWLADTHWLFEKERLDAANKPGWASQFKGMVDRRAEQGFDVYQVELFRRWKKAPLGGTLVSGDDVDLDHFQKNVDPKFAYLAEKGLVIATTLGILSPRVTAEQGVREARMARYVAARYGAYPMCWLCYQECTANRQPPYGPGDNREVFMNAVRGVGRAYKESDGYGHPRTAHSDSPLVTAYRGEDWLDFTMLQGGHDKNIDRTPYYGYYFDPKVTMPTIEGEANYERLFERSSHIAAARVISADDMREKAYQAMQCGCCGYTYAANGAWQATWGDEQTGNQTTYGATPWHEGIDLPGGRQMSYFKAFYAALDWAALVPRPRQDDFIRWEADVPPLRQPAVMSDAMANRVVVYFYRGRPFDGTLLHLQDAPYTAQWFDPRNGTYAPAGPCAPRDGAWQFPAKPDEHDWLLTLRAQKPLAILAERSWDGIKAARLAQRGRNIAPKARIAASSTDRSQGAFYAPEHAVDGNVDTCDWKHWSNDGRVDPASPAKPVSLTLEWPAPMRISKILMYTMQGYEVADYVIQYRQDGAWKTFDHADVHDNLDAVREHEAATPITADAVRFLGKKGPRRQPTLVRVEELEVIAP